MKDIKEIIELIEELWDKHSESLPDDIHGLADEQGSVIMREKDFHKAIKEYHEQFPQPQQKEQFSREFISEFIEWIHDNKWHILTDGKWGHDYRTFAGFPVFTTTDQLLTEYLNSKNKIRNADLGDTLR